MFWMILVLLKKKQKQKKTDNKDILEYVDEKISTQIPSQLLDKNLYNLFTRVQTHSHTSYCMPSQKPPCRFGFPKRERSQTKLLKRVIIL